jgi:tryptophan 7-halogenase
MELFRSRGKIFRDDNELFSEPSWIAVMVGKGVMPQAHHPFADQPSDVELTALMARVSAGYRA